MGSASSALAHLAPARIVFGAILVSLGGIALLLAFIIARRWMRARYFTRRDSLAAYVRLHWVELTTVTRLPERFRVEGLAREVLEAILLDRIAVSEPAQLPALVDCLRRSGILDVRIREARTAEGWRRRSALVVLGRTRAPEAIPALSEGLDSADSETRIAAVRGLGKIAAPEAASPMLGKFTAGTLDVPWGVLKNALLNCCAERPELLCRSMRTAEGNQRELLARILAEVAEDAQGDELLVMTADPSAEIRAAAARGLARVDAGIALSPLSQLAADVEWFVRLRAVVALASFAEQGAVPLLMRSLGDRNRLVRQRAAWALIRSPKRRREVVKLAIAAGDDYGLQALVAELDQCGLYHHVCAEFERAEGNATAIVEVLDRARACLAPGGARSEERRPETKAKEVHVA